MWYNIIMFKRIFSKIISQVESRSVELMGAMFLILILMLASGIAGVIYVNNKMDSYRMRFETDETVISRILTGNLPTADEGYLSGSDSTGKVVPVFLYYADAIKNLRSRVDKLDPTPTPSPTTPFSLPLVQ